MGEGKGLNEAQTTKSTDFGSLLVLQERFRRLQRHRWILGNGHPDRHPGRREPQRVETGRRTCSLALKGQHRSKIGRFHQGQGEQARSVSLLLEQL